MQTYIFIYTLFIQKIVIKQNLKVKKSDNNYNEISFLSYNGHKVSSKHYAYNA
jgi:hypothetical protein